jgi:hypothetical protein
MSALSIHGTPSSLPARRRVGSMSPLVCSRRSVTPWPEITAVDGASAGKIASMKKSIAAASSEQGTTTCAERTACVSRSRLIIRSSASSRIATHDLKPATAPFARVASNEIQTRSSGRDRYSRLALAVKSASSSVSGLLPRADQEDSNDAAQEPRDASRVYPLAIQY